MFYVVPFPPLWKSTFLSTGIMVVFCVPLSFAISYLSIRRLHIIGALPSWNAVPLYRNNYCSMYIFVNFWNSVRASIHQTCTLRLVGSIWMSHFRLAGGMQCRKWQELIGSDNCSVPSSLLYHTRVQMFPWGAFLRLLVYTCTPVLISLAVEIPLSLVGHNCNALFFEIFRKTRCRPFQSAFTFQYFDSSLFPKWSQHFHIFVGLL